MNPSSADLILAAEATGEIDHPTAILYRLYAEVADTRLPEQYRGELSEDIAAADTAMAELATYPADIQAAMRPFLVRPTSPDSYWAIDPQSASAVTVAYHPTLTAASNCVNGWITRPAAAPAKALIWGQCWGALDEQALLARVQEAATYMGQLWAPMTNLMGKTPIADQNDPSTPDDDGLPEAGDGVHDIYLITGSSTRVSRYMNSTGLAVNREAYPAVGPASALQRASYSVFDLQASGGGFRFKSLLAHEFFHALERSWNSDGVIRTPMFWLVEANAQWSEHHFVPEARPRDYFFYSKFAGTKDSLSAPNPDLNPYASWMWPLFVEQEKGAPTIGAIWKSLEGKAGFTQTMNTVDSFLPFETRFRDFAVRLWNERLQPGDPVRPRFQDLDPTFPVGRPSGRVEQDYIIQAQEPSDPPHEFPTKLASLWANYRWINPEDDVKQVIFDFTGLTPQHALDVDVLLKIKDKDWERRKLPTGKTRLCLDDAADDFEAAVVVLSNHEKDQSTNITGKWTIQGLAQSCAELSGTITFTRISSYLSPPGGPKSSRSETTHATITVDMESDPDPLGGGGYIDVASRYRVERSTLDTKQFGDCEARFGTKSDGDWAFTDRPVGPDWENSITGFVSYEAGFAEFAIVAHYPYSVTEDACNLITEPNLGVHDVFACQGSVGFGAGIAGTITEVSGGPDTITINCHTDGPALGYDKETITVTGTLYLQDEDASP